MDTNIDNGLTNGKNSTSKDKKKLRDNKGRFSSGTSNETKNPQKDSTEDDNVVKIRIIKDKKPLPEKEYEGRLEDIKERTAIRFIRAVSARQPRKIYIDGNAYHSQVVVNELYKKLQVQMEYNKQAVSTLKKSMDTMSSTSDCLEKTYDALCNYRLSKNIWRGIAIGLMLGIASYIATKIITYSSQRSEVATSIEQTTQSATSK